MKKIKSFLTTAILFLAIGAGGIVYLNYNTEQRNNMLLNASVMSLKMPNIEEALNLIKKKAKIQDVLIENIDTTKELITMKTELSQDIFWDESFTDFEIFKKVQKMSFYGTGKYSVDLTGFTYENINYDENKNILTININKPALSSLDIDANKTKIYDTDNGLLRFGDIKYTSVQQNEIDKLVRTKMLEELNSKTLIKEAEEKAKTPFVELVSGFLYGADIKDIDINVVYNQ